MNRWRWLVLAALVTLPVLAVLGFGFYSLWESGYAFWIWWPLSACYALALFLSWFWQKHQRLVHVNMAEPLYWTERDRQAWQLVEVRAQKAAKLSAEQLSSVPFFLETAQEMALEVTRFYHPRAEDPVGALTIPEILAVVELVSHDLAEMVDQYLPGGHLLAINDLRRIKSLSTWYQSARNLTWLISGLFSPVNTALRYLATEAGMSKPWQLLQENLFLWFYVAFVQRLGGYLIDLNSGRLKVGARRFVSLQVAGGWRASAPAPAEAVGLITLAFVGQTKMGKSSLINAVLGEQKARTDVLPATAATERYELKPPPGVTSRIHLLDTPGYGSQGAAREQISAIEQAARSADLILLVLHARNPARQADLNMLQELDDYFSKHPDLKMPPILGVLTHIDLLSPGLEWMPPYDWKNPKRPKEQQIQQAVVFVNEQLGEYLAGVIAVCAAPGKIFGIQEWLLPAAVGLLDQAHAVAFLRCLKAEANTAKIRKVFNQLLAAGKGIVKTVWHHHKP